LSRVSELPQVESRPVYTPVCPSCGGVMGKWATPEGVDTTTYEIMHSGEAIPRRHLTPVAQQQRFCTECGYGERRSL
jgi:ribosomal protein S27AE